MNNINVNNQNKFEGFYGGVYTHRFFSKLLIIVLCLCQVVQPCFAYSGVSYSGEVYYGISDEGVFCNGNVYEPIYINGTEVLPISASGTMYEGKFYKGIALSEIKVSSFVISGRETSSSLYQDSVSEECRADWRSVLGKFNIGTTVIVVTGVLTLITGAQVGYICAAAFKGALTGAISGGIIGAIFEATLSVLNGNTSEQIFYDAMSGASSGYMWGAITGAITGAVTGASQLKKGTAVLNSKGKVSALVNECGDVLDPKTGEIIGYGALKSQEGQYCYFLKNYNGSTHYFDFDGKDLGNLKRLGDLVLNGTNTKTASIYGVIDDAGNIIHIGDDAATYLNSKWANIKSNIDFSDLSNEVKYVGVENHPKVLGINYENATGCQIPVANASRHHIVPWNENDENAQLARKVLEKFEIDIDSAYNCAILPQGSQSQAELLNMAYHRTLHSSKYYKALETELANCSNRSQVIEVLNDFRRALYSNNLFWL